MTEKDANPGPTPFPTPVLSSIPEMASTIGIVTSRDGTRVPPIEIPAAASPTESEESSKTGSLFKGKKKHKEKKRKTRVVALLSRKKHCDETSYKVILSSLYRRVNSTLKEFSPQNGKDSLWNSKDESSVMITLNPGETISVFSKQTFVCESYVTFVFNSEIDGIHVKCKKAGRESLNLEIHNPLKIPVTLFAGESIGYLQFYYTDII